MVSETKIQNSFHRVRQDVDFLKHEALNNIRFLNFKVDRQKYRIKELERRLAQLERISIKDQVINSGL